MKKYLRKIILKMKLDRRYKRNSKIFETCFTKIITANQIDDSFNKEKQQRTNQNLCKPIFVFKQISECINVTMRHNSSFFKL